MSSQIKNYLKQTNNKTVFNRKTENSLKSIITFALGQALTQRNRKDQKLHKAAQPDNK
jgi:hypothetical protein